MKKKNALFAISVDCGAGFIRCARSSAFGVLGFGLIPAVFPVKVRCGHVVVSCRYRDMDVLMCPVSMTRCTYEDAKPSVLEGYAGLRTLGNRRRN